MGDPGPRDTDATLYDALRGVLRDDDAVLATVVAVDGAAYRRPGAKRLLRAPPSGNAAEDDLPGETDAVPGEAGSSTTWRDIFSGGARRTATLDLSTSPADSWLTALGGNGTVTLLFDPVDASLEPALDAVADGSPAVVCTVVESDDPDVAVGDRTVLGTPGEGEAEEPAPAPDSTRARDPIPAHVVDAVADELGPVADVDTSRTFDVETADGTVSVFCDAFAPVPALLVVGGQADVLPVARFARDVGFRVRVVHGDAEGFDAAALPDDATLTSVDPGAVADAVATPEYTYAVLMSHEFDVDRAALASLLCTRIPYVGVLGPRKRFEALREALPAGVDADDLARVAAPVGLDLGADTETGVALSIVSEVLAVSNGRSGGRLGRTESAIHPRDGE